MRVGLRSCAVVVAIALTSVSVGAQKDATPLPTLLERAATYLTGYEKAFAAVVSEERYIQSLRVKRASTLSSLGAVGTNDQRVTRADVIAVVDTGHDWMSFRDVFSVDGRSVRDRDERLQKLFLDPKGDPLQKARQIADEGARFNLGTLARNVNFPSMPLTFLAVQNQMRSRFKRSGDKKINGVQTVEVEFAEQDRPSIVRSGTEDVAARGHFWLEPSSGRVMRSNVTFESRDFNCEITVTFGFIEKIKMWVPVDMEDTVIDPREVITGRAAYSNFRKFGVSTDVVIK